MPPTDHERPPRRDIKLRAFSGKCPIWWSNHYPHACATNRARNRQGSAWIRRSLCRSSGGIKPCRVGFKGYQFRFFTGATRAQLEMGAQISRAIKDSGDLIQTIQQSFGRDKDWVKYHAETLAELVDEEVPDKLRFNQAAMERKAVNLWHDG